LGVIVFVVPQVCFILAVSLIKTLLRLILYIPRLYIQLAIRRLFRKTISRRSPHNGNG
jgi:hypothetical protein